jgi:hypothetical protein
VQQVSYGPLIISCYTGFFNVRRGWQSLNMGPRFYLILIRRTGWLWIYTSRTTDGCPFKPKKLSVPFLFPGVPAGLVLYWGIVYYSVFKCIFFYYRAAELMTHTGQTVTLKVAKQGASYHGLGTQLSQPSPVMQRGKLSILSIPYFTIMF